MAILKSADLKKQIKQKDYKNLYFFYGEEKYLLNYYTDMLIKSILGENYSDFNFSKFSGDKMNINDISNSVEAIPLMANIKCVLVEDISVDTLNKNDLSKFKELISDIPKTTILIISNKNISVDVKRSSKYKSLINDIDKAGVVCEFSKLANLEIEKYLVLRAKKEGCVLSEINAGKLIKICGNDLLTLNNEIDKLCAFSDGEEITEDIINKVAIRNLEANVFVLANKIIEKNYQQAYMHLDFLFDKKEDPIAILSVLSSYYIDMYRVKTAVESGYSIQEVAKYFDYKGKDFRLKNAKKNSNGLSMGIIKESLDEILYTDISLKTTKTDKKILLERLIAKLLIINKEGNRV